jgi:Holliday junction DNA helicase RuvA
MALAILSGMDARQFARCVQCEDLTALMRLPGIGKKTAQRLVIEMRDRLDGAAAHCAGTGAGSARAFGGETSAFADAVSALTALGYKPADADRMARMAGEAATSEEIIRAALKALSAP